tara:strand:+ start:1453 stop:1980 length:528 start_codon:yes stop_codon:yes gene_type:complete
MAHFAKIDDNGLVLNVLYMEDFYTENSEGVEIESIGQTHLETHNNWPANKWIKTSYNTKENKHLENGTPFRGNYAYIGGIYDSANNIFWNMQPYNSWTKNISEARWQAPITYPSIISEGSGDSIITYRISWNEELYQSNNNKGWEMSKSNDKPTDINTALIKYDWNGTSWVDKSN